MQTISDILLFTSLLQCLAHKGVDRAIEQASCRNLWPFRRVISSLALAQIRPSSDGRLVEPAAHGWCLADTLSVVNARRIAFRPVPVDWG
ncbi:hypothetical protein LSAT2_017503 [Lamellibrachia satsuma]|nr:hypothetical protein LSAT2_017503 [Lamellibrachia satsuma]